LKETQEDKKRESQRRLKEVKNRKESSCIGLTSKPSRKKRRRGGGKKKEIVTGNSPNKCS